MQPPEDKGAKNEGEEAIGVYDFENENDFDDGDDDGIDDKSKIRKIKPSQQVGNKKFREIIKDLVERVYFMTLLEKGRVQKFQKFFVTKIFSEIILGDS